MAKFLLLLRGGGPELTDYSPEDLQKLLEKYDLWIDDLRKSASLRGAQKLKDESGRLVSMRQGQAIVDGKFAKTKETIGGYFLIEAGDYDEAVSRAGGCPILTHGGSVEIRELVEGACRGSNQ